MSNPTGRDVRNSWVLIGAAAAFALTLGFCRNSMGAPKVCEPGDPTKCAQSLLQNEKAPFAGTLLTTKLAIDQATKAHDCEATTALAVGEATEVLQLQLDKEIALRALELRTSAVREELLQNRVEEAVRASERRWYEDRRLWFALGVVAGAAVTVGAFYGASKFIKANQ